MAKKLTDEQIKNIIAERAEGMSFRTIAKKHKVSESTVRNYCADSDNEKFAEICAQKNEQNAQSVLAYMETKKDVVCEIIDGCLNEMTDVDRLSAASLKELATVMGIVIDKFTKTESSAGANGENQASLLEAIEKAVKNAD